jgi:predicted XRE-type DNA-binding protein
VRDDHWESGAHIFAELCCRESEHALLRAKLTLQIRRIVAERDLSWDEAARELGVTLPEISALMRCEPVGLSICKLVEYLALLGREVDVAVTPPARWESGHMSVVVTPIGRDVGGHGPRR